MSGSYDANVLQEENRSVRYDPSASAPNGHVVGELTESREQERHDLFLLSC